MQILAWPTPVLLLLLVLPAQDATTRPQRFFLDAGEHSVGDLITRSGEFLGRTYLFNSQENPSFELAHVDVPRRLELDANGCEEVVSQLLYTQNYAIAPLDPERGIYEWIYLPGARRMEIKKRAQFVPWEQLSDRPTLKTYVMTAFPLKHIEASRATNTIRPMMQMDQTGMDVMTPVGNWVMITGFRDNVATMIRMLMLVDEAPPEIRPALEERLEKLEAGLRAIDARLAPIEEGLRKK